VGHGLIDDVDRARDAVEHEDWAVAYEGYSTADPSRLTSEDLERFANAAWWLSRFDEADATWQRAYAAYADAGRHPAAAYVSIRLCFEHMFRDEPSVGMGWLMRAQRHLSGEPECFQHGFLALGQSAVAANTGDPHEAVALAVRATDIGQRFGHRDLIALGIHGQGLALIASGDVPRGMALLDEAMTAVVAGELSAHYTGVILCNVLDVCLDLADIGRAGEWNEAAKRWCESLPEEAPFPGICRVNRAAVAGMRGAWREAEAEASRASQELTFNPAAAGRAFYETGEIRRRIGNVAGAEEAFARARELGVEPQPGLALLRLDQGKTAAALTSLRLAVDGEPGPTPRRARLLAALVDAAVAAGDLDTARGASAELDAFADAVATPAFDATASASAGHVLLASGDVVGAIERLRHACAIWNELRLPYEAALARTRYGLAVRAAGDEDGARLELRASLAAFERLGAAPDAARTAALLPGMAELPGGLTRREAEVLRLVASGKSNRDIAAELVISEHTVARHLQNMFAKLGVSSRSAATAFAFEHDLA